jgi:hypothetical protein
VPHSSERPGESSISLELVAPPYEMLSGNLADNVSAETTVTFLGFIELYPSLVHLLGI